ncbi:DNA polymerase alpha subunit B-like isoform X3 [Physella acuta]|uniref:DNA polymerase alpha subunit B-like isoform X3 n=1 Tax=Physella acuta TaxID=109671 RepID=UPI0027DE78DA|nr:DNA polymerase alpha subunit B-like isoform X3 [Physella acuta]
MNLEQTESILEDLANEFDLFGERVNEDELKKMLELSLSYHIDANCIVNNWMAFSSSRKMELTLENLQLFDREWLPKKVSTPKTPKQKLMSRIAVDSTNCMNEEQLDMIGSYATPEEKKQIAQMKRHLTPEDQSAGRKKFVAGNRDAILSTSGSSPSTRSTTPSTRSTTPSAKFSSRSNAGDVVLTFGDSQNVTWPGQGLGVPVKQLSSHTLQATQKYMFQKLSQKAFVLNDQIEEMASIFKNLHGVQEFSHLAQPTQDPVYVAGRVCCDSVGKLNCQSVLLEGSRESSAGKSISLDLSELKQYSLFPGQVIGLQGVNSTGKKFVATQILPSAALPFSQELPDEMAETLRLIIAVGPYSPSDALDFSPLHDLIKYIQRDRPDVCILMGPFIDSKNLIVNGGDLHESYEEMFLKQVEQIGQATQNLGCQVVIVSSYRDVHHYRCVYPQPPYNMPDSTQQKCSLASHVSFASDPVTLSISGVVIGVTSTDILLHLSKSEISLGSQGKLDRLGRLVQHVLHQQSYYPLYPPVEEVNLDHHLWELYAKFKVTPHVIILPSDLKSFIKDIDGCCCVNPGRLTTGTVGGTFAQLVINTHHIRGSPASACVGRIVKV